MRLEIDRDPFQRLVDWADDFAGRHPEHDVFIQYGSARPPRHPQRSRLLDHAQLQTEIGRADVVVCHGGPATITEDTPLLAAPDPSADVVQQLKKGDRVFQIEHDDNGFYPVKLATDDKVVGYVDKDKASIICPVQCG